MANSVVVIEPTTSAVTENKRIRVTSVPSTLIATNLAGVEEVPIFFSADDGANWEALQVDGADAVLSATANTLGIFSPVLLSVTKPGTASASGVYQN